MVSVICVAYNAEKYITTAIESVLNQSFRALQLIVVDDGSTDSTISLLERYVGLENFQLLRKNHTGNPGKLRNEAIRLSKYDLIAFIDADDIWMKHKLEKQLGFIKEYDMICSNAERLNESNEVFEAIMSRRRFFEFRKEPKPVLSGHVYSDVDSDFDLELRKLLEMNYIVTSSVLISKNAIGDSCCFEEEIGTRGEDYLLWLNVSKKHRIRFISEDLVKYRIHEKNLSFVSFDEWMRNLERSIVIRSDYLKDNDELIRNGAKQGCLFVYRNLIKLALYNKDYERALRYFHGFFSLEDKQNMTQYFKFRLAYFGSYLLFKLFGRRHKRLN